jgi:hypothetical protein
MPSRTRPRTRTYPEPPRRYYVYIVEASEKGKKIFYVGQSGKLPEARALEHGAGCKRFCSACGCRHYVHGTVKLRYDLFAQYNPVDTRAEAERVERWLARKLLSRGYHVIGGH